MSAPVLVIEFSQPAMVVEGGGHVLALPLGALQGPMQFGSAAFYDVEYFVLSATKTIPGQRDALPLYTPTTGQAVAHSYLASNALKINATSATAFTLAVTDVPDGFCALSLILVTGATLPTITWPSGVTDPTLTASKTHLIGGYTCDGGATWRFSVQDTY